MQNNIVLNTINSAREINIYTKVVVIIVIYTELKNEDVIILLLILSYL
jgi:hypothetical protein